MKWNRLWVLAVVFACMLSAQAAGPGESSYEGLAGKWKLNFSKSVIGKEKEVPSAVFAEISCQRTEVEVKITKMLKAGPDVAQYRFSTVGQERLNRAEGLTWKSNGFHGDASRLTLDQQAKFMLFTIDVNDIWSLSPDGMVLTIERKISSIPRNDNIRYVFERQS